MKSVQRSRDDSATRAHRDPASVFLARSRFQVAAPDSVLEAEAERVADRVLAGEERGAVTAAPVQAQRAATGAAAPGAAAPASVERALAGGGRPLQPALRRDMERRFGHDFAAVRVHAGPDAAASARELSAEAYTVGRDMVFGAGRFAPGTPAGRRLVAHELAHVVQQSPASRLVQRRPERGAATMPTSGRVQPASPADRREFARMAADFLRGQGDFFTYQPTRSLSEILALLRTSAESGLTAIEGVAGAAAVAEEVRTAYTEAVRTVLVSRTRAEPDAIRTPPTLRELYEEHRDEILPFALPQAQADPGAAELSAELTAPLPAEASRDQRTRHAAVARSRQRLRVVTTAIDMDIDPFFDTQGARMTVPLPANTTARFAGNVPAGLQHGLRSLAARLMGSALSADTTVMLALDLTRFGGGFATYRFTRLDLGGTFGTEILIERQGTVGVEGLRTDQRRQLRERFDRLGFRRASGFSQDEFDQVLIGLSEIPEARLSSLGNLRFVRDRVDAERPDAAAHYDQSAHAVRMFDRAYTGGLTRLGTGGRPLRNAAQAVVHEVGHALDLSALRTTAAATETAQDALLAEFGTGNRNFRIPARDDPEHARFQELQGAVTAADTAERTARSRSGARWSQGQTAEVTDTLARGARQPAFRQAAIRDGARAGQRGFPTTYPNPESFWQEYFAESFMLFQTSPDLLQRLRPHVFAFMQQEFP